MSWFFNTYDTYISVFYLLDIYQIIIIMNNDPSLINISPLVYVTKTNYFL
jgi:hypothetical protein